MKFWFAILLGMMLSMVAQAAPPVQASRTSEIWDAVDDVIVKSADEHFKWGRFPEAAQLMRLRYAMFPESYNAATDLGFMLESLELEADALAVYVEFRLRNPNSPDGPLPEAEYYFKKKMYAKVPPLLEPALKLSPHPNAFRILAHSYEKLGRFRESLRTWDAYLRRNPDDQPARNNRRRVAEKVEKADP